MGKKIIRIISGLLIFAAILLLIDTTGKLDLDLIKPFKLLICDAISILLVLGGWILKEIGDRLYD